MGAEPDTPARMRSNGVTYEDIFSPGLPGGLIRTRGVLAWEGVADYPNGRTWFGVGVLPITTVASGGLVGFPRLVTGVDVQDRPLAHEVEAVLCPRPITGPQDLYLGRASDIGGPSHRASVNVPIEAVMSKLDGKRDRGRVAMVQHDLEGWVREAVRYDIATERPTSRDVTPDQERMLRHRVRDLRRRLADGGVIPWACWPRGVLPRGAWWTRPQFAEGLAEWNRQGPLIEEWWQRLGVKDLIDADERRRSAALDRAADVMRDADDPQAARTAALRELRAPSRQRPQAA